MNVQDYASASNELRSLILSQAELRLSAQNAFAEAGDARAATLTGVAAALASAAAGVFAVSLSDPFRLALAVGSLTATTGFAWAAHTALQSARCSAFHPCGYPPHSFEADVRNQKPLEVTEAEMAEDLDERLAFNSRVLEQRGTLINQAMDRLWQTPIAAIVGALGAYAIDLVI